MKPSILRIYYLIEFISLSPTLPLLCISVIKRCFPWLTSWRSVHSGEKMTAEEWLCISFTKSPAESNLNLALCDAPQLLWDSPSFGGGEGWWLFTSSRSYFRSPFPVSPLFLFLCFGETQSIVISWESVYYRLYIESLHDFPTWLIIWQNFKWSHILLEFQMIVSLSELQVLLLRNLMASWFSILRDFFSSLETLRIFALSFWKLMSFSPESFYWITWFLPLCTALPIFLSFSLKIILLYFPQIFCEHPTPLTCATF